MRPLNNICNLFSAIRSRRF